MKYYFFPLLLASTLFSNPSEGQLGLSGEAFVTQNIADDANLTTYIYDSEVGLLQFLSKRIGIKLGISFSGTIGDQIIAKRSVAMLGGARYYILPKHDYFVEGLITIHNTTFSKNYPGSKGYKIGGRVGYTWNVLSQNFALEPYFQHQVSLTSDDQTHYVNSARTVGIQLLFLLPTKSEVTKKL